MKKLLFVLVIMVAGFSQSYAQEGTLESDSIYYEKVFSGYMYYQQYTDGYEPLNFPMLKIAMQDNPAAYTYAKKASTSNTIGNVLGFVGGALVGIPIGTAVVGGDPNWALAAIGGGMIAIGIPVTSSANKKMRKAVDIYNSELDATGRRQTEFNLVIDQRGVGLGFSF